MTMRLGVFGGTFNPVHIGHLRSALEVAELMGLDELRFIPSARPPHRETPQVSAQDRLAMVRLAVADEARFRVDDLELRRSKASYTIETLEALRAEVGVHTPLFLLLGWDAYCGLPSWHRWQELLDHCHIVVMQRPDAETEAPQALQDLQAARGVADPLTISTAAGQIAFVRQAPLAISATRIRHLLASGRSVRYLLPETVLSYIQAKGLYRAVE